MKPSSAAFVSLIALPIIVCFLSRPTTADNWPQWRGASLDSVSNDTAPTEFGKDKNLLWRVPMPGSGGASPVVWDDKVFVTSVDGDDLVLLCVGMDGTIKWRQAFPTGNRNSRDGANSASPSPSTDGEHVWAMMSSGDLSCFTVDGELVWTKDLQKEYGKFDIQFGMATTPILDDGTLYVSLIHGNMRNTETSVGQVIALDAKTGDQKWLHRRLTDGVAENKHGYASPTIYKHGDQKVLVTHGGDYAIGHSIKDGSELWRCGGLNPKGRRYNRFLRFVASPCYTDGLLIIPSAKNGPVLGLKPDLTGVVTEQEDAYQWKLPSGTPDVATPVVYDGLMYLAGEKGDLTCVDATTGEVYYRERLSADKQRATPIAADGKIFIAGRRGTVFVVQAGEELKVLAKNKIGEETTASPAIANGRLFVRTFDSLYAFGEK